MSWHNGQQFSIAPNCYERVARAERTSALQGSGLGSTVGPCAQRRVALMPRVIATAIETHCGTIGAKALCILRDLLSRSCVLATKPRAK